MKKILFACVLLLSVVALQSSHAEPGPGLALHPAAPRLGEPALVEVRAWPETTAVTGTLLGADLHFHEVAPGLHRALASVPLDTDPGPTSLAVTVARGQGLPVGFEREVTIQDREFESHELSVSSKFDKLSSKARARARRDRREISAAWERGADAPAYSEVFQRPIGTEITGKFGTRRVFNKREKSRHLGVDLDGVGGERIRAANRGTVALARDCYYSGKTVFLDHGGGLFTVYFHLRKFAVKQGQAVERGQVIGRLGKSGRVTGPHLHFGAKLHGTYVDPLALLELPLGLPVVPAAATEPTATGGAGAAPSSAGVAR